MSELSILPTGMTSTLWVDSRKGSVELVPRFEELGYNVITGILHSGDILVKTPIGSLRVEIKTAAGLFSDLLTQRVHDQLRRMRVQCDIPVLLVAGNYSERDGHISIPGVNSQMSYYFMSMAELDIQLSGIFLMRCPKEQEAEAIDKLIQHLYNDNIGLNRTQRPRILKSTSSESELQAIRFLMGLPGIGEVEARRLYQANPTTDTALSAAMSLPGRKGVKVREFLFSSKGTVEAAIKGSP